ncbi:MAG: penicillin acylase family protein [Isosphaeraceae bacterium]
MRRLWCALGWMVLVAAAPRAGFGGEAESLDVPGLIGPVEILRDRWGIAHIYAKNEHDVFFAQGFNAARDRLFQLEMWRRQATGTWAEVLGAKAVDTDLGARLLRYRGDMARELNHYHPRGAAIVQAFVDGINAYVDRAAREPSNLPIEFRMLGITPGRWTPEVVVSRHNGLFRNATSEVQAARVVRALGAERARELLNLEPGRPRLDLDPALDDAPIEERVLRLYQASRNTPKFTAEDVLPEFRGKPSPPPGPEKDATSAALWSDDASAVGSNNWVVSGARTFSRAPLLANDPHRTIQLPSLRYWVHLVAPGWDVIGGGEPALPGVSIGHNQRGAWGFTIFPIDQEDLYIYETDPADPLRYRYANAWETMRVERETIPVKGGGSVTREIRFTRHGPVLFEDRERKRAYALRAAWLEPGCAPYLASLRVNQAGTWDEFREACSWFRTPSENLVWADRDGHIGWQAVGLSPQRKTWDGLVPVPGDGRFEWDGYLAADRLPYAADPPKGWFATANQNNLPDGYPFAVGFQWTEPFRFSRIEEQLGTGRRFTLADMTALQHDELSLPARALTPMLRGLTPSTELARKALARLSGWDHVLDRDSVPAAVYVAWERALKIAVGEVLIPESARAALPPRSLPTRKLIDALTAPDGRFGEDPLAGRNALLLRTFEQAVEGLSKTLGPDLDRWWYGQPRFKHSTLKHPLSDAVREDLRAKLDVGPLPRGGYAHTVNSTSDSDNQATGASFRVVVDLGDWDRSLGTNTPGQSGDPDSPHYRDLFAPWATGGYFPAFYSRPRIETVTAGRTVLRPR